MRPAKAPERPPCRTGAARPKHAARAPRGSIPPGRVQCGANRSPSHVRSSYSAVTNRPRAGLKTSSSTSSSPSTPVARSTSRRAQVVEVAPLTSALRTSTSLNSPRLSSSSAATSRVSRACRSRTAWTTADRSSWRRASSSRRPRSSLSARAQLVVVEQLGEDLPLALGGQCFEGPFRRPQSRLTRPPVDRFADELDAARGVVDNALDLVMDLTRQPDVRATLLELRPKLLGLRTAPEIRHVPLPLSLRSEERQRQRIDASTRHTADDRRLSGPRIGGHHAPREQVCWCG